MNFFILWVVSFSSAGNVTELSSNLFARRGERNKTTPLEQNERTQVFILALPHKCMAEANTRAVISTEHYVLTFHLNHIYLPARFHLCVQIGISPLMSWQP